MKRPVTSLCRPGKKTACGQSVPGAGTISAHRDALRRAVRSAGQKPPGRGLKNSSRRGPGAVRRLRPWGSGGQWEVSGAGKAPHWAPAGAEGTPRRKNSPGGGRGLCTGCAHGGAAGNGVSGAGKAPHWAPGGTGVRPGSKTAPGGAGGCLDAGYGCYLPRAIRVIWMHRVGSTARPRIMPS